MRKKISILGLCLVTITGAVMLTSCGRSVSIEGSGEKERVTLATPEKNTDEKETTTKKNSIKETTKETEEATTKGSYYADEEISYEGLGYKITLDLDWEETTLSGTDKAFKYNPTSDDGFAENINVIVQDLTGYDIDLTAYLNSTLDQYKNLNYSVDNYRKYTVDGREGYLLDISTVQYGKEIIIRQFFVVTDSDATIFTFTADKEDFEDLEEDFYEILNSIRFALG